MGAKYKLARVQRLVPKAWIHGARAREEVARRLACGRTEANEYVRAMVRSLRADNFAHTKLQNWGEEADVYGVKNAEGSWYVKVYIRQDGAEQLVVVSCHLLERDLLLANGNVLQKE